MEVIRYDLHAHTTLRPADEIVLPIDNISSALRDWKEKEYCRRMYSSKERTCLKIPEKEDFDTYLLNTIYFMLTVM
jgi:hypothetical protein